MYPRYHILLGAIFTSILYFVFPETEWYYLLIIFLASFLIDFDHYAVALIKTKRISLPFILKYYKKLEEKEQRDAKKGIFKKGSLQVFHTIEFHILVFALGYLHPVFWYALVGMIYHSLLDFGELTFKRKLYRREFFLLNWIIKRAGKFR